MLDILLQILSVLGILLLVVLGVLAAAVLLVLFFPVTYRADGKKNVEELALRARANWLFGLVRVRYSYPEPGTVTVKLLWFTLFKAEKDPVKPKTDSVKEDLVKEERAEDEQSTKTGDDAGEKEGKKSLRETENTTPKETPEETSGETSEETSEDTSESKGSKFLRKIEKIKYTIIGTYDKIRKMWKNISYYAELLREEETRLLFSHAMLRLWKILKSIRPRKLRADLLFGTGAPDTTGYVFGVYAALSPTLGPYVAVTPDFERAVLQGEFEAAGHIMAAVLLWHALRIVLDRRLWRLLDKLKGKDTKSRRSGAHKKRRNGGKNGR